MHAPSAHRDILRRLKAGEDPRALLAEARKIEDPAWAAQTVLAVSGHHGLQFDEARHGVKVAKQLAKQVERPSRRGEVYAEFARAAPGWRAGARNPQADPTRQSITDAAVDGILAMPDGEWTQQAIEAAASHVDVAGRQRLLGRALSNPGFEAAGAKAVVRAGRDDVGSLRALLEAAPPEVQAAVFDDADALTAAWAIADPATRAEALRVLVWKEEEHDRLRSIAGSAERHGAEDFVRLHTQVGARLDKLGHDPSPMFAAARKRLREIEGKTHERLEAKLAEAEARAAGVEPVAETTNETAVDAAGPDAPPRTGHTLALHNTYDGGLKRPHLQAVARAAPLCWAFGLDLALLEFPTDDLDSLLDAAHKETGIGEGVGYLRRLHEAGRIHTTLSESYVVATTPKPAGDKAFQPGRHAVTMVMGVGPRGLPAHVLNHADAHYEVTGQGVSLETATAMGILADRLARLPAARP